MVKIVNCSTEGIDTSRRNAQRQPEKWLWDSRKMKKRKNAESYSFHSSDLHKQTSSSTAFRIFATGIDVIYPSFLSFYRQLKSVR